MAAATEVATVMVDTVTEEAATAAAVVAAEVAVTAAVAAAASEIMMMMVDMEVAEGVDTNLVRIATDSLWLVFYRF